MTFENIVEKVDKVDSEKNYWFVRTDNGEFFQHYYEKNIIAIGWDYITVEDLQQVTPGAFGLKQKIAQHENLDIVKNSTDKSKATTIANKLLAFYKLKKGDVVVIPSENSSILAFGIVADNKTFTYYDDPNCPFAKRRRIRWIDKRHIEELDNIFYQVKINRHSISSIKNFESYIDKVLNTLFIKNGYSHFVLDIKTQDDVNFNSLLDLVNNVRELTEKLNEQFNLGEDLDKNSIKLNLQSPGKIEFKFLDGKSLILLAFLLGPLTANDNLENVSKEEVDKLIEFKEINRESIEEIEDAFEELKIDQEKINSIN